MLRLREVTTNLRHQRGVCRPLPAVRVAIVARIQRDCCTFASINSSNPPRSGRNAGSTASSVAFRSDVEFGKPLAQRIAIDAKHPRSAQLIALGPFEREFEQRPLEGSQCGVIDSPFGRPRVFEPALYRRGKTVLLPLTRLSARGGKDVLDRGCIDYILAP